MREISRFQMNVANATRQLQEGREGFDGNYRHYVYERFSKSRQEPFRIASSLYCYFALGFLEEREIKELEHYMCIRIRNVCEALIEEDAPEKMEVLQKKGWFGLEELNGFIRIARERKKIQTLIYLMKLKNDRYGYREQEWVL